MKRISEAIKHPVISQFLLVIFAFGCASHQGSGQRNTASLATHLSGQERADYAYTQGEAYSQDGKPRLAIERFREALLFDKESSALRTRLATEYLRIGSVREAMDQVDEALKNDPGSKSALLLKGSILGAVKNYSEAIETFEKLVQVDANNTDAIASLGALYAENGQYDLAQAQFKKLAQIREYPMPEMAYYYLGRIFEEAGDKASLIEAEKAYRHSLQLKPNFVDSAMSLAALLIQQNKSDEALQFLENWQASEGPNLRVAETLANMYILSNEQGKALKQLELVESLNPGSADIKLRMALIQIEAQRYPEAALLLEAILSEAPESDRVRFYLGAVYVELKENEEAIKHFKQVPHYSSFYVDSVTQAATLLKQMRKSPEGEALVKKAVEHKDDVPQLYLIYAGLLDDQQKHEESYKVLLAAKEKFPEDKSLLFMYGMALDRQDNKEGALKVMQELIAKDKNHALALNYVAYTYAETRQNLDVAKEYAQRALAKDPKNPYILDTMGWVYFQKGDFKEALVWLELAFEGAKEEGIILEHLGDTYYQLGLIDKAQTMYDLAFESSRDEGLRQSVKTKLQALRDPGQLASPRRIPAATSSGP